VEIEVLGPDPGQWLAVDVDERRARAVLGGYLESNDDAEPVGDLPVLMVPTPGYGIDGRPLRPRERGVRRLQRGLDRGRVDRRQRPLDRAAEVAGMSERYALVAIGGRRVVVPPRPHPPLDGVGETCGTERRDSALDLDRSGVGRHDLEPLRRGEVGLRRDLALGHRLHHSPGVHASVAEERVPPGRRRIALCLDCVLRLGLVGRLDEVHVVGGG
jgi:hypothetical protein